MSSHTKEILLLLYIILRRRRRRNRQRRFKRCFTCNPDAILKASNSIFNSYSAESDVSSTPGECYCTSNNSSLVTRQISSRHESDTQNSILTVFTDKNKTKPTDATQQARFADNADCVNNSIRNVDPKMRRYPITTEDISHKYLVGRNREVSAGITQNACVSSGTGESYTRHMAEIEYWVKTHRPPCTYGMPLSSAHAEAGSHSAHKPVPVSRTADPKQNNSAVKRPIEVDSSPETTATKKISTQATDESPKLMKLTYFSTKPTSKKTGKANGNTGNPSEAKVNGKNVNGDLSTELQKKFRSRQRSTPAANRVLNIEIEKKNTTVNKSSNSRDTVEKASPKVARTQKDVIEIIGSPTGTSAGPSHAVPSESREAKPIVMNDSDTSVLTAPYIRSTRNGNLKTKSRTLTRQRASRARNEFVSTRSFTKRHKRKHVDLSFEMKESSGANNSKLSDSSLDIFGADVTKDSTNSRKSTLRSWSGKLATLHFSGCGAGAGARRSEPTATRAGAGGKRTRLNTTAGASDNTDATKSKVPAFFDSDKDTFNKKKFFV